MVDRRIALIASRFRDGGVERWMTRLADGLADSGCECDLVTGEQPSVVKPRAARVWAPQRNETFPGLLARYLEAAPSAPAMAPFRTSDYSTVMRIAARNGAEDRVFLVTGAFIRERLAYRPLASHAVRAWKTRRRLKRDWSRAAGVITVSPQVRSDWIATGAFPEERVHAPPPPVVGPDIQQASLSPIPHSWLEEDGPPVILGVGRLQRDKGFHRLIDGFARVRERLDARLIILGKGDERSRLECQVSALGIGDAVAMPGFVDNPYSWMRAADVLVMPSSTETFGFVLVEAMYLGTPFIADIAPPGPRSIRDATGQGTLVRIDSADELAAAIESLVNQPPETGALHQAATIYDAQHSVPRYVELFDGK